MVEELLSCLVLMIGIPLSMIFLKLGYKILTCDKKEYERLRQKTLRGEYVTDEEIDELLE
jgi:hypothetical protein